MASSNADAQQTTKEKVVRIPQNQARYQQALMEHAYQHAAENIDEPKEVGFDFRGRVVLTLSITDEVMNRLAAQLIDDEPKDNEKAKDKIKRLTGIKTAQSVRCALDITTESQGSDLSKSINSLREKYQIIYGCLPPPQRDAREQQSVIGLYEEILSYLDHQHHSLQSYLSSAKGVSLTGSDKEELNNFYLKAKITLHHKMQASCSSIQSGLSTDELNEELDNLRLDLATATRDKYLEVLGKGSLSDRDNILKSLANEDYHKHFTHTAAHHHDMLGTDFSNGLVSYITESGDRTAHNKPDWESLGEPGASAFRTQTRHCLNQDGSVKANVRPRASARVPSLADKGNASQASDVERIKRILAKNYKDLNAQLPDNKPVVYNLLTSLEGEAASFLDSLGPGNKQNLSAERIIKGVHAYNREHTADGQLVFLQNMGVNHFTENLSNEGFFTDPRLKEATLMADLAMLYTLSNNLTNPDISNYYNEALAQYKDFLSNSRDSDYFHQSSQGKEAVALLNTFKATFAKAPLGVEGAHNCFRESLARQLTNLYAQNEHYDEKNQNLIQALSIFLEEKSISGCKSANERNEDVQKRVAMLISLEERLGTHNLNTPPTNMATSTEEDNFLQTLREGGSVEQLRSTLSLAANKHRAYGDECSFSHADQASASKLELQSENLDGAKKWVNTGFKIMKWGVGIGMTIGSFLATSLLLAAIPLGPLSFLAGAGGALLGVASTAVIGFVGLACVGVGLLAFGIGTAVGRLKGYDTNTACEAEMSNIKNKHSKPLQSHYGQGKTSGVKEAATAQLKGQAPLSSTDSSALNATMLHKGLGVKLRNDEREESDQSICPQSTQQGSGVPVESDGQTDDQTDEEAKRHDTSNAVRTSFKAK